MADNVQITPGSGANIATDEVTDGTLGTVQVQYVKLMDGTLDGTSKAAVGANGLKVDGSAVTQPVSGSVSVSGTPSINNAQVSGTAIDVNSGAKSAGTQRVVIATDQPQLTNALKVDGSAVTQPVSGTITANAGSGNFNENIAQVNAVTVNVGTGTAGTGTQRVAVASDSSITANAGTNLNTSALALETGGNLATVKTNTDNLSLGQASTTSGQKGNLVQGAVTTAAPSYTTAQTDPLSLTTSGALRVDIGATSANATAIKVDGSAVTQPVSGTVTADTELPAAAALSDAIANPTTPMIGAGSMVWNGGAQWERMRGDLGDGSAATGMLVANPMLYNGSTYDRARGDLTNGAFVNVKTSVLPTGAALDATLTGGTAKSIIRGGAKGSTAAADVTSTASGANHQPVDVAIYDAAGTQITSFGGGTQYAEGATTAPATGTAMLGRYQTSPPSLTNGQMNLPMLDSSGNLKVSGSLSVGGTTDKASFTEGVSTMTPVGGEFNENTANLAQGTQATVRLTPQRGQHVSLRDSLGNEKGTSASPIVVSADVSTVGGVPVATTADGVLLQSLADELGDPIKTTAGALNVAIQAPTTGQPVNVIGNSTDVISPIYQQRSLGYATFQNTAGFNTIEVRLISMGAATATAQIDGQMSDGQWLSSIPYTFDGTIPGSTSAISFTPGSANGIYVVANAAKFTAVRLNTTSYTSGTWGVQFRGTMGTISNAWVLGGTDTNTSTNAWALPLTAAYNYLYNGASVDRTRSAVNAANTTGTGVTAAGLLAQLDDTSPTAITENQFGNLRMNADRSLNVTLKPDTLNQGTVSRVKSAASTNSTNLKGSAGNVHQIFLTNSTASTKFFKFYNKATAPTVGTDTPYFTVVVPANGNIVEEFPMGIPFTTGIGYGITGAVGDADTTATAVDDVTGMVMWR